MIKALIIIALCAFSASAQVKKSDFFKPYGDGFKVSSAAYWGGVTFDLLESRRCVRNGTCIERNPLLRTSTGQVSVAKGLLGASAAYALTLLLEKKHPKLATWIRFGGGAGHVLAGGRNW